MEGHPLRTQVATVVAPRVEANKVTATATQMHAEVVPEATTRLLNATQIKQINHSICTG